MQVRGRTNWALWLLREKVDTMRRLLLLLMAWPLLAAAQWMPDTLGGGYEMRYVDQGTDYSGPVRCSVVRLVSPCAHGRGVLYVHGYNDYFFQAQMGQTFVDSCYSFYAVDLRKYGRSILPGQHKFEVRNLNEYFADIDSALQIMGQDGIDEVVMMGHSTGGLVTALYMSEQRNPMVKALILNSPFLEWNLGKTKRDFLIPIVGAVSRIFPKIKISNGHSTAYGESLLRDHHGEWEYNTDWKTFYPQKVTSAWLRAIDSGHSRLRKGRPITVPILLMRSDNSVFSDTWDETHQHGDGVLNVDDILKYGLQLGPDVTEAVIPGGLHDLSLSATPARALFYADIFNWLRQQKL